MCGARAKAYIHVLYTNVTLNENIVLTNAIYIDISVTMQLISFTIIA